MKAHHWGARFHWLIIGPFLIVVALLAALGATSAEILSAVRAYVGAESLWSKGQKDAIHHLATYAESRNPIDYQKYLSAVAVPLGDRTARLELQRPNPDFDVVRRGLLEAGNHPGDVGQMIWLFRNFQRVPFMAQAVEIWTEGDLGIAEMNAVAEQVRHLVVTGNANSAELRALRDRLPEIDAKLTDLEERFSSTMGAASRTAQRLVQFATLILALSLGAAAVLFSWRLLREQSRMVQALRTSESRFRLLWEAAPDAIVVFDQHRRIQYANAAVKELFGHDPSALVEQDLTILEPEHLRHARRLNLARYLETGHKSTNWRNSAFTGLHRDGREIPTEVAFSHLEHNGEHQFVGFFRDVSVRHQAEQDLRASQERLQRALDATGLCLWDFDVESGNIYLSESWSEWLGGPREPTRITFEALGDRVHETDQALLVQALITSLKDPLAPYRVEHRVRKHNGDFFWILSEGRIIERGPDGRASRMVGTNRDVTPLKHAEAIRHGLETQLRESQKMEAIGTLAAGIAHDFNNILGAILGNVALAREDVGVGHAAIHSLQQIHKSAFRARTLVQQILAFGRRQPQELVSRPLRPLIQETLMLMRAALPAGVNVDAVLTDAPMHVQADATQMQQVMMNLCTNAWHALQGSAGRITVGLKSVTLRDGMAQRPGGLPPGDYAHVWVSDTGCGMDAATQARIFEPFFTTKPVGQGTGLGLSVVHGIVAAHHGALTVDTAIGHGSTFHLYIPLVVSQNPAPQSDWGPLPLSHGQGQHVLYVDDDEVMLVVVERLLLRLGYRVTCHQDPRKAVADVRDPTQPFDIVLSDFNMPEFSGLDLAWALKRICPDLPVVITSGHLTDEERAELLRAGVREFMHKENTLEELGPLLKRLLEVAAV